MQAFTNSRNRATFNYVSHDQNLEQKIWPQIAALIWLLIGLFLALKTIQIIGKPKFYFLSNSNFSLFSNNPTAV